MVRRAWSLGVIYLTSLPFLPDGSFISSPSIRIHTPACRLSNQRRYFSDDKSASSGGEYEGEEPSLDAPAQSKLLDPLLASLTRMDEETKNAPTTKVPIFGELILDRSLFVLLPVALFAVLGLIASVYVGVNAQDRIVEALNENAILQGVPEPPPEEGCRGLCSTQEQDLEGLRVFMNSFKR